MLLDNYFWFRISDMEKPKSGECIVDHWWIVKDDKITFWRNQSHPQCNADKSVAEFIRNKLHPDADIRQIKVVYVANATKF